MNNEQAVLALKCELSIWEADCKSNHPTKEALKLAIKALEEPTSCVLMEFGKCSYKETGCSDCLVKAKIRNALGCKNDRPKGKWNVDKKSLWDLAHCSACGELCVGYSRARFCPSCGVEMEVKND